MSASAAACRDGELRLALEFTTDKRTDRGLLPHVLHHVGILAGTALVAGSGGTALFGALGLLGSIPLLLRPYRRFGTWAAPAIGLLIISAMFALSAFVIGPAISGTGGDLSPGPVPGVDHTTDHPTGQ